MMNEYIRIPAEATVNVTGIKPVGAHTKWAKKDDAKKKQHKEEKKTADGEGLIDIRV